jgi:hypothetical protein
LAENHHSLVEQNLERITVRKDRLEIRVWLAEGTGSEIISVPWWSRSARRKRHILVQESGDGPPQMLATLIAAIAIARHWLAQLTSGKVRDTKENRRT